MSQDLRRKTQEYPKLTTVAHKMGKKKV